MAAPTANWTIADLTAQAALALSIDYDGAPNDRIRDVPDLRTIRYYTTLGLLDRPAQFRGRTGLYGRRHLLQLVAIKRLQTRGLSLTDIQAQLLGMAPGALEKLARLPAGMEMTAPAPESERSEDFWRTPPTAHAPEPAPPPVHPPTANPRASTALQGVALHESVTLLLASPRVLEDDDLAAIRAAAAPLLKLLDQRHLTASHRERTPG